MIDNKEPIQDENEHTFKTIEARPVELTKDFDYFGQKRYRRILSKILVFLVRIIIVDLYAIPFLGYRIRGIKNYRAMKHQGAVVISNHVHPFDSLILGASFFPKRFYFAMLKTNLGLPIVGKLFYILGGAPIPDKKDDIIRFQTLLDERLANKDMIAVFPEASLRPYCDHIRPFKKGAFRFAFNAKVAIIPMVFIFKKPRGLYRFFKKKPCIELHIVPHYDLVIKENKYETLVYNTEALQVLVSEYFNAHSEPF